MGGPFLCVKKDIKKASAIGRGFLAWIIRPFRRDFPRKRDAYIHPW